MGNSLAARRAVAANTGSGSITIFMGIKLSAIIPTQTIDHKTIAILSMGMRSPCRTLACVWKLEIG